MKFSEGKNWNKDELFSVVLKKYAKKKCYKAGVFLCSGVIKGYSSLIRGSDTVAGVREPP